MSTHPLFVSLLLVLVLVLGSCKSSMGPKTIPPDGFNYNERIALQDNEQMLLNIVRLRYLEVPQFLNVASVINQYTRTGTAGINGSTSSALGEAAGANVGGSWSDRPTITYTPLSGQSFSQSLLTPLPPSVIFFLIQSGWAAERLFRLTSRSINRVQNERSGPRVRAESDPKFTRLLEVLGELQRNGLLGMQFAGDWPRVNVQIYFPVNDLDEPSRLIIQEFKELLNLDPDTNQFSIDYGLIQKNDAEVVVQTRSMLEMIASISWYIDVPQNHIDEGRTASTFRPDDPTLIQILSSEKKPKEAFISIKYKDHWYYIDDRDIASKTTFGVMRILLSLASDGSGNVGPLISIGN